MRWVNDNLSHFCLYLQQFLRTKNNVIMKKKEGRHEVDQVTVVDRGIWSFYEWAVIFAPIAIMLSHWYIFYVFSNNPHELMKYSEANEICIAWIYSVLYLYVPLMLLPASYLFRWCNLFRIPFIYFIFINVERSYYGSWFCTNEMIDTHYILIYCIIMVYLFEIFEIILKNLSDLLTVANKLKVGVFSWIREKFNKGKGGIV